MNSRLTRAVDPRLPLAAAWRRRPRVPAAGGPGARGTCSLLIAVLALGCGGDSGSVAPEAATSSAQPAGATAATGTRTTETPAPDGPVFLDAAVDVGLDFVHFNGMSGEFYTFEHVGGGSALFDYDRDGDLDVYLTQGHMLGPGKTLDQATLPPPPGPLTDRLYRNDLEVAADGRRRLRFTDVTAESGLAADGYGMGVAAGDYDNDGWIDLYVTTWGSPNQLWRNNGDRTFSDVTAAAGVGDTRWAIAAAFFDYDRDGWLDLFAANYLDAFTYSEHKECNNDLGIRDYCGPASYRPVPDVLYRNRGDGTFAEASAAIADGSDPGSGLGVVSGDFNDDGRPDLYVANDALPNHLWINRGDGSFRNEALLSGAAVNAEGMSEAGMGVNAGDVDGDGDEDIFVAHLDQETNTLYLNTGLGVFEDRTDDTKLAAPSWASTGFGTAFLDYDNDGFLDLFVANGAVQAEREQALAGAVYPLAQRNQLYHNLGGSRFVEVTATAGPVLELVEVSRGAAVGDLDNDGDTDLLVVNNAGPVRLLLNQVGQAGDWLGLEILSGRREALGAWVEAELADGSRLGRRVRSDGSYASANDPRVLFGLSGRAAPASVRVSWPDGSVEQWEPPPLRRYTTLRQGTGTPVSGGSR